MNISAKVSVNLRYKIILSLYWMLYCVASGFLSLGLQSRGLGTAYIGIIAAVFGVISALIQPVAGRICDRHPSLTWKKMVLVLLIPFFLICLFMSLIPNRGFAIFCIGMLLLLANTLLPFVNSALSSYRQQGIYINFGIARGLGSAMYAFLSLLLGELIARLGVNVISVTGVILSAMLFFAVWTTPFKTQNTSAAVKAEKKTEHASNKGFAHKYPAFLIMFLSCVFMMTTHIIIVTYLLQVLQTFGGGSRELGISNALQAIVEVPPMFALVYILKKVKSSSLMATAAFGFVVKTGALMMAHSIPMIYLALSAQCISYALFASVSVYYSMDLIQKEDQVTGQALMACSVTIGTVAGSLAGGMISDVYGIRPMLTVNFLLACVGFALALLSNFVLKRQLR